MTSVSSRRLNALAAPTTNSCETPSAVPGAQLKTSQTSESAGSDTEEEPSDDEHTLVGFGDVSLSTIDSISSQKQTKASSTGSIRRLRPLPPGRRNSKGIPAAPQNIARRLPRRQISTTASRIPDRAPNRIPVSGGKAYMSPGLFQSIHCIQPKGATPGEDFENFMSTLKRVRSEARLKELSANEGENYAIPFSRQKKARSRPAIPSFEGI